MVSYCARWTNILMTNELSEPIADRFCRMAAFEHENHRQQYYALGIVPCAAALQHTLRTRKPIPHGYRIFGSNDH